LPENIAEEMSFDVTPTKSRLRALVAAVFTVESNIERCGSFIWSVRQKLQNFEGEILESSVPPDCRKVTTWSGSFRRKVSRLSGANFSRTGIKSL
jgi:hypothetical protein